MGRYLWISTALFPDRDPSCPNWSSGLASASRGIGKKQSFGSGKLRTRNDSNALSPRYSAERVGETAPGRSALIASTSVSVR